MADAVIEAPVNAQTAGGGAYAPPLCPGASRQRGHLRLVRLASLVLCGAGQTGFLAREPCGTGVDQNL